VPAVGATTVMFVVEPFPPLATCFQGPVIGRARALDLEPRRL
jgi:hypothetical protein